MCEKKNLIFPNPLKKKKKNEEKNESLYLTNDYCKLIKIRYVASPRWQVATMQKLCAFMKGSWNYACVKIAF